MQDRRPAERNRACPSNHGFTVCWSVEITSVKWLSVIIERTWADTISFAKRSSLEAAGRSKRKAARTIAAKAAAAKTGVQFQTRGVAAVRSFSSSRIDNRTFLATGPAPENTSDHPPTPISGRPVFGIQLRTPGIPPNAVRPADDLPGRARHRQTRRSVLLHLRSSIDASFKDRRPRLQSFSRPCKPGHYRAERQLRHARYFFIRKLFDIAQHHDFAKLGRNFLKQAFQKLAVHALYQNRFGIIAVRSVMSFIQLDRDIARPIFCSHV